MQGGLGDTVGLVVDDTAVKLFQDDRIADQIGERLEDLGDAGTVQGQLGEPSVRLSPRSSASASAVAIFRCSASVTSTKGTSR